MIKGNQLIFISQIKRDGSGTVPIREDYAKIMQGEDFTITPLSLTEGTFIAHNFNSFVVKMKEPIKLTPDCSHNDVKYEKLLCSVCKDCGFVVEIDI